jgi:hypothetical protein
MERPIVTISHERDEHLPFVERYLDRPLVVIDPTAIADDADNELSFEFAGGKDRVIYKGEDVSDAVSVWYRKPKKFQRGEISVDDKYQHYSFSALQRHVNQLHAQLPEAQWVSDYHAIQRANNKTLQYKVAHDLGMNVPDTLMTSNVDAAKEFIDEHPVTIIKSLATSFTTNESGEPLAFWARKVRRGDDVDLSGLHLAPAVFQQGIDAVVDLRVTVVGDQSFPAEITVSDLSDPGVRDWRAGHFDGNLSIVACEDLPSQVGQLCVDHTKKLGLRYGCTDLVVDQDGVIWFLENNPNGQYGFVEQYTGMAISKALADLLMHPS